MAKTKKLSLKLLIDTQRHRVLFAEAGKEFVDFLFHIFSLPIGTVVSLLTAKKGGMVGSLGDLHNSLKALSPDHLLDKSDKDSVLNPKPETNTRYFYRCSYCSSRDTVTDIHGTKCLSCSRLMSLGLAPTTSSRGFVKGSGITYVVMDNLEVKPMSTISSIDLLSKFNVKDVTWSRKRLKLDSTRD